MHARSVKCSAEGKAVTPTPKASCVYRVGVGCFTGLGAATHLTSRDPLIETVTAICAQTTHTRSGDPLLGGPLLPITCYLLLVTYNLLPTTCYLLLAYLPFTQHPPKRSRRRKPRRRHVSSSIRPPSAMEGWRGSTPNCTNTLLSQEGIPEQGSGSCCCSTSAHFPRPRYCITTFACSQYEVQ